MLSLSRARQMGLPELAGRSRQEVWKWIERLGGLGDQRGRSARLEAPRLRRALVERLFPGPLDARTPALLAGLMPGHRDALLASAEDACRGRFDLLGYRGLSFGDPVDWRLDPVSGKRSPLVHWSALDPLDHATVGDSKVVWELNRHQWLVTLGQAYRLTRDERFARRALSHVREWTEGNPRPLGINWASSLEVALRLISWCWVALLLSDSAALGDPELRELGEGIAAHAAHVERYLSHYFSPNTHLTGEALGLLYAGLVCGASASSSRWAALGQAILEREIDRQVLADGVYFEQATCYQRYTAEIYLHFLGLAGRNGLAVSASLQDRVRRLVGFLAWVRRPDGRLPAIGDADGGWLLPLVRREPDDGRGLFATAAAVLPDQALAFTDDPEAPEPVWLLGDAASRRAPVPTHLPRSTARVFPLGGYVVMRSGWQRDAHQLIFDVGPLGCPVSGGHGHADLLGIQCSAFGEPFLVDPGTFAYTGAPAWRDHFRSAAAHSTLTVDGVPLAAPQGPFSWRRRPRARLGRFRCSAAGFVASAEHDAYLHLGDPVRHQRTVAFLKAGVFVLVDEVLGRGTHRLELRFSFAPVRVDVEDGLWLRARGAGGHGLLLRAFAGAPLALTVAEGEEEPIRGWVSPDYGVRRPAPSATYSCEAMLPARIVTAMVPLEHGGAPRPLVEPADADEQGPTGLTFAAGVGLRVVRGRVRLSSPPCP